VERVRGMIWFAVRLRIVMVRTLAVRLRRRVSRKNKKRVCSENMKGFQ